MNASLSSTFRPEAAALILIDHQVGTMQLIKTLDLNRVRRSTIALAQAATILGMPVLMTSSQEDHAQGPLMQELAALLPQPFAARIKRSGIVNAWNDPSFRRAVDALNRPQLIMAGVTTDVCLVFTAIDAAKAGFSVQAVLDASGSPFEDSEACARQRMMQSGVVLTATNTLIAELTQDWSTASGQQLIRLLFEQVLPPITQAGT